jgi:RHS repeat-associated protein
LRPEDVECIRQPGTADLTGVAVSPQLTPQYWRLVQSGVGPLSEQISACDAAPAELAVALQALDAVPGGPDIVALTDEQGNTRATYGYTAYGEDDDTLFTGVDAPDPTDPDQQPYNTYRYAGQRFDPATDTYDMGFRDYDPGLNRFLTRDTFNGALTDMALTTSPWTMNRYTFAGGNPISLVEIDGHLVSRSLPGSVDAHDTAVHLQWLDLRMQYPEATVTLSPRTQRGGDIVCWDCAPGTVWVWEIKPEAQGLTAAADSLENGIRWAQDRPEAIGKDVIRVTHDSAGPNLGNPDQLVTVRSRGRGIVRVQHE